MNKPLEICISYKRERKLIFFQPEMQLSAFILVLQETFGLGDKAIKLFDPSEMQKLHQFYLSKKIMKSLSKLLKINLQNCLKGWKNNLINPVTE